MHYPFTHINAPLTTPLVPLTTPTLTINHALYQSQYHICSITNLTLVLVIRNDIVVSVGSQISFKVGWRQSAVVSCLDVRALAAIVRTSCGIVGENSDVYPGGGVPVRIVVPLLGALVATPITVLVLTSETCVLSIHILKKK